MSTAPAQSFVATNSVVMNGMLVGVASSVGRQAAEVFKFVADICRIALESANVSGLAVVGSRRQWIRFCKIN